jgi:hypothetical protein
MRALRILFRISEMEKAWKYFALKFTCVWVGVSLGVSAVYLGFLKVHGNAVPH